MKIIKILGVKSILHHILHIIRVKSKKKMKWIKKRYNSNRKIVLNKKDARELIKEINQVTFNKTLFELYNQENLEIEDLEEI
nr:MAG: hypothetical protein [Lokiarchaeota virus Skoll Meg22_1214]